MKFFNQVVFVLHTTFSSKSKTIFLTPCNSLMTFQFTTKMQPAVTAFVSHLLIFFSSISRFSPLPETTCGFFRNKENINRKTEICSSWEQMPDWQEPSCLEHLEMPEMPSVFKSSKTAVVTHQYNTVKQKKSFPSLFKDSTRQPWNS